MEITRAKLVGLAIGAVLALFWVLYGDSAVAPRVADIPPRQVVARRIAPRGAPKHPVQVISITLYQT